MAKFFSKPIAFLVIAGMVFFLIKVLWEYGDSAYRPRQITVSERQKVRLPDHYFDPPDTRQQRFDESIEALSRGPNPEAIEEIQRLALLKPDFIPAHRYLIEQILVGGLHKRSRVKFFQLRQHLERVSESGDDEVTAALAQHYIDSNEHERAIELLRKLIDSRPATNAQLATMLVARNEREEGTAIAEKTIVRFRKKIANDPYDAEARIILADNLRVLDRPIDATNVLRESLNQLPELHDIMMEHAIAAVDDTLTYDEERSFELMKQGIADDPTSLPMWTRIVTMSLSASRSAGAAEEFSANASRRGISGGIPEFARGTMAYKRGDKKLAIAELEKAHALAPNNPRIIERLAMYLSNAYPPQLERAFQLSDALVNANLDQPIYRGTRGQILALMDQQSKAIEDLEAALAVFPRHPSFVTTLSLLYEKQGEIVRAVALRADADPTHDDVDKSTKTKELLHEVLREFKEEKQAKTHERQQITEG